MSWGCNHHHSWDLNKSLLTSSDDCCTTDEWCLCDKSPGGRDPKSMKGSLLEGKFCRNWLSVGLSSQPSFSQSICRYSAEAEELGQNHADLRSVRPFSWGSTSGKGRGRRKERSLRPLVSPGTVDSLLTQHYRGGGGAWSFEKLKLSPTTKSPYWTQAWWS